DDHTRGLSEVLRACTSAELVVAAALKTDEFAMLAATYRGGVDVEYSGIAELSAIWDQVVSHGRLPRFAMADMQLLDATVCGHHKVSVHALSPSHGAMADALHGFSRLVPVEGTALTSILRPPKNPSSVVLRIAIGGICVLLGGDLEVERDVTKGWSAILDSSALELQKAEVFKVPHHGSKNAHSDRVWRELLHPQPIALVTPYRASHLPTDDDQLRLAGMTHRAYLSAPPRAAATKWMDRGVAKEVELATRSMRPIDTAWGHIRVRRSLTDPSVATKVDLFGSAQKLD
ncbi:MAG: hypothetical protein LC667_06530, partial [Thioalkalivibrio sp.]|nr:hypothetical protein [Thioalkalivibrio sp.]